MIRLPVGSLGRVVTGRTPPSTEPHLFGEDHPFLTPTDMGYDEPRPLITRGISAAAAARFKNQLLPPGATCVVCIGATIGKVSQTNCATLTNQQVNSIVPDKTVVDEGFLFYKMRTLAPTLVQLAGGAATPILNKSAFSEVEVTIPDLQAQRQIADILSPYDRLIENNLRRITLLEQLAKRLFDECIGAGEEEMRRDRLNSLCKVIRGRAYRSADLSDQGGVPFINLKCIQRDGGFRIEGLKSYSGKYKETQTARPGDIVMAVTDMTQERRIVAHSAIVPRLGSDFGIVSMDLVKIMPNADVPPAFLYSLLRWSGFADEVKQHANGANVLHLAPALVESAEVFVPSKMTMERYAGLTGPILECIAVLEAANAPLRDSRDFLLPRLMSGEIVPSMAEVAMRTAAE